MSDISPVPFPDKLTAPGPAVDWFDDTEPQLGDGDKPRKPYRLGTGWVTASGRRLLVRTCSSTIYNAGFRDGDRLLVAEPPAQRTARTAVITLVFDPPVSDLGCYVGGVFGSRSGDRFSARMWVYHTGTPDWDGVVTGTGQLGDVVAGNAVPIVPFLGVRGVNGRQIERVGIEASLIGNVPLETVAISGVLATP